MKTHVLFRHSGRSLHRIGDSREAEEPMNGNFCRARLLALTAAALMVAAHGASAQTTLTVGKAAPNADAIIPVNIGDKLGIFNKHGLDLKIFDFTGGSKMSQAMAAGSIDIGDGAGTEMALVAKGVPMR